MKTVKLPENFTRRVTVMSGGLVLIGLGVALFKLSLTGNDPFSALVMAMNDRLRLSYAITLIMMNAVLFIFELALAPRRIGVGTFANWFGVGFITDGFLELLKPLIPAQITLPEQLALVIPAVLVLSLGASMYQQADLGIAPYDVLSIIMSERTRIPYFADRLTTDGISALGAFLLGGIVGLGTVITALGMGPVVSFCDSHITCHLLGAVPQIHAVHA